MHFAVLRGLPLPPPASSVSLPLFKQLGKQNAPEASEKFMEYARQFMTIN